MVDQIDSTAWRKRAEWDGPEAPRRLFDTLVGNSGMAGGVLGDAFVYRGINLLRLFEGTWITLIWPQWFQELAILDDRASRTTKTALTAEFARTRIRVAKCVVARHPGVKIEFQSSVSAARWSWPPLRDSRLARPLSMLKAAAQIRWRRTTAPAAEAADLAFFPWSAKIAPAILPVASALVAERRMSVCIAGWESSPSFDLDTVWQWDTPVRVRSPRILMEAWRAAGELRRRWIALCRDGRLDLLGQWRGWDLRPLLLPFLDATVNHLSSLIANILTAEEWCKRRRLKGIVVPQDGGESVRSLIAGARLARVRSFSVQYGYAMDNPEISEPCEDLTFLNGESTKRWFLERGASPNKLIVVGSTAYDRMAQLRLQRTRLRLELAQQYNLDPRLPWVVVATWFVQSVYSKTTKEAELALIMEAAAALPHVQLLLKLHPSDKERGKAEAAAADRFALVARIVENIAENEPLLCAADALVCNYTTLAIMAIVAQTPVLIVDLGGIQQAPNRAYVDEGVAEFANTTAAAEAALQLMLKQGKAAYWATRGAARDHFITERLCADDGQAAGRMLEAIKADLNCNGPLEK